MSKHHRSEMPRVHRRRRCFAANETPGRVLGFECLEVRRLLTSDLNVAPTLAALDDLLINEDAPLQTVNLQGITAGAGESQPLRVTATSDNESLVINPVVNYTSPETTGTLTFAPVPDQDGFVTLTVKVEDGGVDGDLETLADNGVIAREFTVTVVATNDLPTLDAIPQVPDLSLQAGEQTIVLTGISAGNGESQGLRVIATSDNTSIIGPPTVDYLSPQSTAVLRYTPTGSAVGSVVLTVTVIDGGLDNDFATTANNGAVQQQVVVQVSDTPWTNPSVVSGERQIWDVNDSGTVTLLDALLVIQLINRFPQYETTGLPPAPADLDQDGTLDPKPGHGLYPDVNGDGKVTLGDALVIINKVNLQQNLLPGNPEGESGATSDVLVSSMLQVDTGDAEPTTHAAGTPLPVVGSPQEPFGETCWRSETDKTTAASVSDEYLWSVDRSSQWLPSHYLMLDDLAADIAQHMRDENEFDTVWCILAEADLLDLRK